METHEIKVIARIRSDFKTKFGIPRQSGLVEELTATVVFEPEFRNPDALRGLEGFSHLWLIWQCSENVRDDWAPTVRPPRLGGNTRMGVFATRSPFRPNSIGLSCVRLLGIRQDAELGTVIDVGGADLMDGTPIYDVKPYAPYTDSHPEALGGFASTRPDVIPVVFPDELLEKLPAEKRAAAKGVLAHDPRPRYQDDGREYGMSFAGFNLRFRVADGVLTVTAAEREEPAADTQVFESERIRFVAVTERLVPEYLAMMNDIEGVARFIGRRTEPVTEAQERKWVRRKLEENALVFSMLEKDGGGFVGNIELMDVRDGVGELGIAIRAEKQDLGYGTEAVAALARYGMERLGLERIFLKVYPDNPKAIRVYRKCGFREYDRTEEDIFMELTR